MIIECTLTQNFGDIERIYKMSSSKPTDNEMIQIFSFELWSFINSFDVSEVLGYTKFSLYWKFENYRRQNK